jgi:hypothetical protein
MSENYRMSIFDAAALGLTFFERRSCSRVHYVMAPGKFETKIGRGHTGDIWDVVD